MELLLDATMVAKICNVSRSKAYSIIQQLNKELKSKNYMVIAGKVPRQYFLKRFNLDMGDEICQ